MDDFIKFLQNADMVSLHIIGTEFNVSLNADTITTIDYTDDDLMIMMNETGAIYHIYNKHIKEIQKADDRDEYTIVMDNGIWFRFRYDIL